MSKQLFLFFYILVLINGINCFIEGIYCGKENCYDVLGVSQDSTKSEIARAYRQLAKKYHPDRHKSPEAKQEASLNFTQIATAYEVLKDDDTRKDYDYMLEHPDEIYRHYYHYYRRRMAPKVDVRIVLAVTITIISVIQYWGAWNRYKSAIDYLVTVPKYRMMAYGIAKEEGLLDTGKKRDRRSKDEKKDEEEKILKKIIEEKMDIRGGYSKPSLRNVLWLQLILLPYTLTCYMGWWLRWIWKFTICRHPYGEEEKLYLIRRYLGCSSLQWDAIEDEEKKDYIKKELWIKEKFKVWKQAKEDEMKAKLAESARYKSYRRYMKNHGPGQITFED